MAALSTPSEYSNLMTNIITRSDQLRSDFNDVYVSVNDVNNYIRENLPVLQDLRSRIANLVMSIDTITQMDYMIRILGNMPALTPAVDPDPTAGRSVNSVMGSICENIIQLQMDVEEFTQQETRTLEQITGDTIRQPALLATCVTLRSWLLRFLISIRDMEASVTAAAAGSGTPLRLY